MASNFAHTVLKLFYTKLGEESVSLALSARGFRKVYSRSIKHDKIKFAASAFAILGYYNYNLEMDLSINHP